MAEAFIPVVYRGGASDPAGAGVEYHPVNVSRGQRLDPPTSAVVAAGPLQSFGGTVLLVANQAYGHRVVVPKTGILAGLSIYVVTAAGNIDVGIYDLAEPRNKLYSTGSIACPTATQWTEVGAPNLPVVAGQSIEFVVAGSGAPTLLAANGAANAQHTLPASYWPVSGGSVKLVWTKATSFPLPATLADAGLVSAAPVAGIIARIT